MKSASAVVVLTEWLEFRTVDWRAAAREVQRPLVIDARNLLDPAALEACGFSYRGIGRP
ncbi:MULTISPECIES: UDP binding domain-containing protein [Prescottella]|uniref:UDP binding domain-containing protein n=1 Tax=Prescottella TaxID=2979332 RepID=UPI00234E5AD9|nr:UDP binding domain-containing protein [Prescottella equi]